MDRVFEKHDLILVFLLIIAIVGIYKAVKVEYDQKIYSKYVLVETIDETSYIQCISSVKYIVSETSKSKAITPLLQQDGKPQTCTNKVYSYQETQTEINQDKQFVITD